MNIVVFEPQKRGMTEKKATHDEKGRGDRGVRSPGVTGMTPDRGAVQHGEMVYPRTDTSRQLVEKSFGNARLDVQG